VLEIASAEMRRPRNDGEMRNHDQYKNHAPHRACETCPAFTQLEQMGIRPGDFDRVIALAAIRYGQSTLFNALTGLKQHTGNWPGKTVTAPKAVFQFNSIRYKIVDLPGTYSLLSASQDEECARFYSFGQPSVQSWYRCHALERNLNLSCKSWRSQTKFRGCQLDG